MSNILVTYNHQPIALVNARRATLLGPIADLPAGHPLLRLTIYMASYAHLIASGQHPGPTPTKTPNDSHATRSSTATNWPATSTKPTSNSPNTSESPSNK